MSHADTESLVRNPLINYVNFTGSVEGGHQIQKAASDKFIGNTLRMIYASFYAQKCFPQHLMDHNSPTGSILHS